MVVDLAQGDDMRIETGDLVDKGVESPRHDRGVAPDIELKNTQFVDIFVAASCAASYAAKQQQSKKIP